MDGVAERVYYYSPVWLQNRLVSAAGRRFRRQRYGAAYIAARSEADHMAHAGADEIASLQEKQLREFVLFAKCNSDFYRRLYGDTELPGTVAELDRLPIVDKETLRSDIDSVFTVEAREAITVSTGGTTGKALQVRFTSEDFQRRMALLDSSRAAIGMDTFNDRKATFSGRSIVKGHFAQRAQVFWRHNSAYNQRLYSTFHLNEETAELYLKDLNSFQPQIINGFVSAIYDLAGFVLARNLPVMFKPKAVLTTSETLLPFHREAIEAAFGAPVYNQYASAEGAPFVVECSQGSLHYRMDSGVIELVDFGDGSEAVVTSFTTHGTPLIRYRIGDRMTFSNNSCSCGSSHPVVAEIEGRAADFLVLRSGRKVSLSHLADVIKGLPNSVLQMQFRQEEDDRIVVLVRVDTRCFNESHLDSIRSEMAYRFGVGSSISVNVVDEIPREASGKTPLIKRSRLDRR